MESVVTRAAVDPVLVEHDVPILSHAPLAAREAHRGNVTPAEFLELLKQGFAQGRKPEDWLQELLKTGQLALARHLLLSSGGSSALQLRRISQELQAECDASVERVQRRLGAQRTILDHTALTDLEDMLSAARQLASAWWFDRAREELAEIDRLLDLQIADAIKQRQGHFDMAQQLIMNVRREFMYAEPILNRHGTTEVVWELLGYADRLSASVYFDLKQIEELCDAIKQLYQGAALDQSLLVRFRAGHARPAGQDRALPGLPAHAMAAAVTAADAGRGVTGIQLEQEPLSSAARALLEGLLGSGLSLVFHDLTTVHIPANEVWNEAAAATAQLQAERLASGSMLRLDEAARASELLKCIRYLVTYWAGKRKSVPDRARRELSGNLFCYATLMAMSLIKIGRWDAAGEYLRTGFRIRAFSQTLSGAERPVFDYFAAYGAHTAAPEERHMDALLKTKDYSSAQVLLGGLRAALECGDENARFRVAQGLVKLAIEDSWLLDEARTALHRLQREGDAALILPAFKQMGQLLRVDEPQAPIEDRLALLVRAYVALCQRAGAIVDRLLEAAASIRTLRAVPGIVQELRLMDFPWEPTDQELLSGLGTLAGDLVRFFEEDLPFQDRDRLAEMLLQRDIPAIMQLVVISPTRFGVLGLRQLVDNIQLLIEEEQSTLHRISAPTIQIEVEKSEWRSDNLYYCHLIIENTANMRADGVKLRVESSPINEYKSRCSEQELGTLYPRQQRTIFVTVKPTPLEKSQDAFALFVRLQYRVPGQTGYEARVLRLRVEGFAAQRPLFQPIANPYVVGGIVENRDLFRGRDELINALLTEVAGQDRTGSVVIFGQKRSGKSSLLYHLSQRTPDFVIPILFDMPRILSSLPRVHHPGPGDESAVGQEEMLGRFLLALAKETTSRCRALGLEVQTLDWDGIMTKPGPDFQFGQFLEQFRGRPDQRRLLFLFDEFTALIDKIDEAVLDETIMRLFKSLIERGYFSCIICGLTEVYEAVKRFANQLAASQPRMVDYLDHEAASGLIQEPSRLPDGRSRFYSQQVVNEIFELTAGSPFYIQIFCHRLIDYMNDMEIETVTAADVSIVTKSLIEGSDRLDPVQFDNLYRYKDKPDVDDRPAILEGLVAHLLAHETAATKKYAPVSALYRHVQDFVNEDELDETLGRLEQRRSVVQEVDEPSEMRRSQQPLRARHYRIRVDLFRRWLFANRPVDDEALRSFERKLRQ